MVKSNFFFFSEDIPAFHELYENTIYIGTFSKTVTPGLRVGYMMADHEHIQSLNKLKLASNVNTSVLNQMVVYSLLRDSEFAALHIANVEFYHNNYKVMRDAIVKYFPENVYVSDVSGGFFVWCKLPDSVSTDELFVSALDAGVAFVPGHVFFVGEDVPTNYMRLNFSNASESDIVKGIKILGNLIKNEL